MAKPETEVGNKKYYKDIYFLYEVLNSLDSVEEVKLFIKDILTRAELRMLKRRWHIANLLIEGNDIRTTAMKARTSTATVSKVKRILEEGHGGFQLAFQKMNKKIENENHERRRRTKKGSKYVKTWFT